MLVTSMPLISSCIILNIPKGMDGFFGCKLENIFLFLSFQRCHLMIVKILGNYPDYFKLRFKFTILNFKTKPIKGLFVRSIFNMHLLQPTSTCFNLLTVSQICSNLLSPAPICFNMLQHAPTSFNPLQPALTFSTCSFNYCSN